MAPETRRDDTAAYLFGLTSEAMQANATACGICGARAVMFNPGNVAVMCHACGMPLGPERQDERLAHLLTYVTGAAAQMGPSSLPWIPPLTPPSDQVPHEIHQTPRPHTDEDGSPSTLEVKLAAVINEVSAENRAATPDYVLARYLGDCLAAYGRAINSREAFFGRADAPGTDPS